MALAVEAAAEGLRAVGQVADRRPGFACEVDVRAEDDVFAGVIRLGKRSRKRLELVRVLDDPGVGLRAGAALEEVEHRRVGLDKDVRAEHGLAVARFPAVPRGGTHGNEHVGREVDVVAREELVRGGEALGRQAVVHGVDKGGAGGVHTGDVVRVAADEIADGGRAAGRAVDRHGSLAVIVAVGHDAVVAAARGHLADKAAHGRFIRRDGHRQCNIAGCVAVVEQTGRLADETADGGAYLGRGRIARNGRHVAEGGAVGDHTAVGVRGNEAAGRAQAFGGFDLHGHIRPGVGEVSIEVERCGQAAAIRPLLALRADDAAHDGAVIDARILAHAEVTADETADERTFIVSGDFAVHCNVGQVQVRERGAVCQHVEEADAFLLERRELGADAHAGDGVVAAVKVTGEVVDGRPRTVEGDVRVERDILARVVDRVVAGGGGGKCAQLRLRLDDEGIGLGAGAGGKDALGLHAEQDFAVGSAPALPDRRTHGRKARGRVAGELAAVDEVFIRRGEALGGDALVHNGGKGVVRNVVLRRDLVVVDAAVPAVRRLADRDEVLALAVDGEHRLAAVVAVHDGTAALLADEHAGIGVIVAAGIRQSDAAGRVAVFRQERGRGQQAARSGAVILQAVAAGGDIAERGTVADEAAAAERANKAGRVGNILAAGGRDVDIRVAVGNVVGAAESGSEAARVHVHAGGRGNGTARDRAVVDADVGAHGLAAGDQAAGIDGIIQAAARAHDVDRNVRQLEVADRRAVCQRLEETGAGAIRRLRARADGHAGNGVAVAVKAAAELGDRRPRLIRERDIGIEPDVQVRGAELAVLGGLSETAQLRLSLDAVGVSLRALAAGEEVARIDRLIAALTGRQQAAVFDLPAVPAVFTHAQQAVHRNAVAQQADGLAGEIRLRIGKLFLRERVGKIRLQHAGGELRRRQTGALFLVADRVAERGIADRDRLCHRFIVIIGLRRVGVEPAAVSGRAIRRRAGDAADGDIGTVARIGHGVHVQGHVGVAGVDRAAAVADNAACAVHHGAFAVVADRAERRAVDDRGIVARPADDPARAGIAALGHDLHVRPGVAHQALAAVIADDTADVGVVVVTGRIADDRAADPAAVDHAAVAGAGRQNGDCRVFIRGLVVDERILDAQVADRTALADKAEEAGILIRGGLGFRADGQAGDRVVVAVEDAVEAAAVAADRRPALAGEVEIGVERNILARVGLTTVDRGRERLDLVDRADQIRVRLRADAGGKDAGVRLLRLGDERLAQRVVDRGFDAVAAHGRAGNTVDLGAVGLDDIVKERGDIHSFPIALLFLADEFHLGDLAVGDGHFDLDLAIFEALSGALIDTVLVARALLGIHCGQIAARAGVRGIGRERAADEHDHQQHQGQEPFGDCLVHGLVITS